MAADRTVYVTWPDGETEIFHSYGGIVDSGSYVGIFDHTIEECPARTSMLPDFPTHGCGGNIRIGYGQAKKIEIR